MISGAQNESDIPTCAKDEVCVSRNKKIQSVMGLAATGAVALAGIWKLFGMEYVALFPVMGCFLGALSSASEISKTIAYGLKQNKKDVKSFAISSTLCAAFVLPLAYALKLDHNNQTKLENAEDFLVTKLIDQAKSGEGKPQYCTTLEPFWDKQDFFPHAREVCLSGEVNHTAEGAFMLKVNGAKKIPNPVFMVSGEMILQGKRYVPAERAQVVNAF